MKPKRNYPSNESALDRCQTPDYALIPLVNHIPPITLNQIIWEPASGEELLTEALVRRGYAVYGTDILNGQNFFEYEFVPMNCWCIITNPPFGVKYKWLKKCYELGIPFALLMPVEVLGSKKAQKLFREYGISVIFPHGRINFKMPDKGWKGDAQFPTAWFTWGMGHQGEMIFDDTDIKPYVDAMKLI